MEIWGCEVKYSTDVPSHSMMHNIKRGGSVSHLEYLMSKESILLNVHWHSVVCQTISSNTNLAHVQKEQGLNMQLIFHY